MYLLAPSKIPSPSFKICLDFPNHSMVMFPSWQAAVDGYGNLHLTKPENFKTATDQSAFEGHKRRPERQTGRFFLLLSREYWIMGCYVNRES